VVNFHTNSIHNPSNGYKRLTEALNSGKRYAYYYYKLLIFKIFIGLSTEIELLNNNINNKYTIFKKNILINYLFM